jgi:hypothetical protein
MQFAAADLSHRGDVDRQRDVSARRGRRASGAGRNP